jgi:hypothetical protein
MPDYGWEVMLWNPVTGWSPYGKPSQAAGITVGHNGTAQAFAEQLLSERARELTNTGGRLRATVVSYDSAGPLSEILASVEMTRPITEPGRAAGGSRNTVPSAMPQDNWQPAYAPWRRGGWYVTNIRYPDGATGCVSRNYPDGKWRIVCDSRPDAHEKHTFRTRDDAARAERGLAAARWGRVAELAAGLAPVTGPGTAPNTSDAPCAACGTVVKAGQGLEVPGTRVPAAVLDSSCSRAIGREQADPGGSRVAPDGYAHHVGQPHHGPVPALAAESLPPVTRAGLRPGKGAAASPGRSARSTARRRPEQSPAATRGRGRR